MNIWDPKWVSNLKSFNWNVLGLVKYYNFGLGPISIRVHLQKSKFLNFEALRISLGFQLHSSKSELPRQFRITPKDIWITLDFE